MRHEMMDLPKFSLVPCVGVRLSEISKGEIIQLHVTLRRLPRLLFNEAGPENTIW